MDLFHCGVQDALTAFPQTLVDVLTLAVASKTSQKRPAKETAMPNDRLRAALLAAGLTVDDVCSHLSVDPKTVERWIAHEARKPHRRTRRQLAELLDVNEVHLWPELVEDMKTPPSTKGKLYTSSQQGHRCRTTRGQR